MRISAGLLKDVEPLVVELTNAGGKAKTEQMTQGKHVVSVAQGIGIVLLNRQVGLVIQQAIQGIGGLTDGGANDLDIEGVVLIG